MTQTANAPVIDNYIGGAWKPAAGGSGIPSVNPARFREVVGYVPDSTAAELDEAARIDGASRSRLFWSILLPLLTPAVATIGIYDFIHIWNEFVFGLVLLTTPERMTLPLGLRAFYGEFMVNVPGIMAALTLGTLPLLIAYFAAQEKVVAGLAAGAVKG